MITAKPRSAVAHILDSKDEAPALSRTQGETVSSKTLTSQEAAEYLGIAATTLAIWRCTNRYQLPYIKVGRLVRYRPSDLDAFMAARTIVGVE